MIPLSGKYRKAALLGLFVACSLGLSLVLVNGPDHSVSLQHNETVLWSLRVDNRTEDVEKAFRAILQRLPWGQDSRREAAGDAATRADDAAAKAAAAALAARLAAEKDAAQWRLMGVVRIDSQRVALVRVQNKVTWYEEGETLPNGDVLRRIHDDHVEIQHQGKTTLVRLYQGPPASS